MGRFRESMEDDGGETGIDMSPLIDCVFILLIFFIVTTVFVEETGVEVDKPQAASGVQLEKNSILIAITSNGEVVYGGRDIGVAGVQPLIRRMTAREDMPIILQADTSSRTGVFAQVLDEVKLADPEAKVSLATRK